MHLLDEGLGRRRHRVDAAVEPHGRVDAMGEEIAGDAAACHVEVEPPEPRTALRHFLRDRPVLQELGAIVEDPAETPSSTRCVARITAGTRR